MGRLVIMEEFGQDLRRLCRIYSQMHVALKGTVEDLKGSGIMTSVDNEFESVNSALREMPSDRRDLFLGLASKHMAARLAIRGYSDEEVTQIANMIKRNWIMIVERKIDSTPSELLDSGLRMWEEHRLKLQERRKRIEEGKVAERELLLGTARLITGAGLIVYDAAELAQATVPIQVLYTSFWGGALLFFQGLEGIL